MIHWQGFQLHWKDDSTMANNGDEWTESVVPNAICRRVMQLGPDSMQVGHVGTEKTVDRIPRGDTLLSIMCQWYVSTYH